MGQEADDAAIVAEQWESKMTATVLIAPALMAQSAYAAAPAAAIPQPGSQAATAAYTELASGDPATVKARIQADSTLAPDDAAALINLGAAYARTGQNTKALDCYLSAMASDRQYEVRLADGRWVDSRRAARMAANALGERQALALR